MIFGCFHEENLKLVNPKALDIDDDAFFLATHTEVPLIEQDRRLRDQGPFTEEEFLNAFLNDQEDFVFALVRGTVGIGKSHLIRWAYLRLRQAQAAGRMPLTRLHLIERSGTNLRDIIRRVIGDLGGELLEETRRRLAEGQQLLSSTGLSNTLLDSLAIQVDPQSLQHAEDVFGNRVGEERDALEYCFEHLPILFRDDTFRRSFIGEGNIVNELVELTIGRAQERKARDAERRFSADDFLLDDVDINGAGVKAREFARDLERETTLRQAAAEYVNSRLPAAVQSLINLGRANFTEVFREVRRELRSRGEQLILLIEDIAAFEFVDHQLLEALIEEPGSELCPLRSAVGVTDGFLEKIDATHLERTTLRLKLTVPGDDIDSYVSKFTANYLRALRTPLEAIKEWADEGAQGRPPGPEPDDTFARHAAFGEIEGISLFPFNSRSIATIRQAKFDAGTSFNARSYLDEVVCHTLGKYSQDYEEGRFPTKGFRERYGKMQTLPGRIEQLRQLYGPHLEQVAVIEELWGKPPALDILKEFGVTVDPEKVAVPEPDPTPIDRPDEPARVTPPPKPESPATTESPFKQSMRDAMDGLKEWFHGGPISQKPLQPIRELLSAVALSAIEWDRHQLKKSDWTSSFKPPSFNLVDQKVKSGGGRWAIEIPRKFGTDSEFDTTYAILAFFLVEHYGHWDFKHDGQHGTFYLRHVGPFVDWLTESVIERIFEQTSLRDESLLQNAVYLLLVGARLRGCAGEKAPATDVVDALFRNDSWADTSREWRSSWQELIKAYNRSHAKLVELTKTALNCAKNSGPTIVLDTGRLLRLLPSGRRSGSPPTPPAQLHKDWSEVDKLRGVCDQHLNAAVTEEFEAHRKWQSQLQEELGESKRVDLVAAARECITRASEVGVLRAKRSVQNVSADDLFRACDAVEQSTLDADRLESSRILDRAKKEADRVDLILPRLASFDWTSVDAMRDLLLLLHSLVQETTRQVDAAPVIDSGLEQEAANLKSNLELLDSLYTRIGELAQ